MSHAIKSKKALLTRVRRIKGQAEALEKALENEVECTDLLQQIAAVRGAINGLMAEVLEGHIREHLGPDANGAEDRHAELDRVVTILRSYLK